MTTHAIFPKRIETDRLAFERFGFDAVDVFEVYDLVTADAWHEGARDHMPWYCLDRLDEVVDFVEHSETQWRDCDVARYQLRTLADGNLVGLTSFGPDWDCRRGGSDVVLARDAWGNEFGLERAAAFVALTFEVYDLDAYYSTCAAGNDRSRRMLEKLVARYGGRHEGLLRQHSARPNGTVTDQHRFSITRPEYERSTDESESAALDLVW